MRRAACLPLPLPPASCPLRLCVCVFAVGPRFKQGQPGPHRKCPLHPLPCLPPAVRCAMPHCLKKKCLPRTSRMGFSLHVAVLCLSSKVEPANFGAQQCSTLEKRFSTTAAFVQGSTNRGHNEGSPPPSTAVAARLLSVVHVSHHFMSRRAKYTQRSCITRQQSNRRILAYGSTARNKILVINILCEYVCVSVCMCVCVRVCVRERVSVHYLSIATNIFGTR